VYSFLVIVLECLAMYIVVLQIMKICTTLRHDLSHKEPIKIDESHHVII